MVEQCGAKWRIRLTYNNGNNEEAQGNDGNGLTPCQPDRDDAGSKLPGGCVEGI